MDTCTCAILSAVRPDGYREVLNIVSIPSVDNDDLLQALTPPGGDVDVMSDDDRRAGAGWLYSPRDDTYHDPQATQPAVRPVIVLTSITPDAEHTQPFAIDTSAATWDVTCAAGATLTVTGEVQVQGNKVPDSAMFRMPIRASDGRELVLLAVITQGALQITAPMPQSGVWQVDADLINRDLPDDKKMDFAGLKVFVLQV